MGKTFLLLLVASVAVAQSSDSTVVVFREGTNMAITLCPTNQHSSQTYKAHSGPCHPEVERAKAITDIMSDSRQPSFSPNGNEVVFQSYRDGGWHLWKVNKDGSGLTQLTFGKETMRNS